jgi:hypothetical protein
VVLRQIVVAARDLLGARYAAANPPPS